MPPLYRIFEIILYSLLNFLPYLILAMYPFQKKFRFTKPIIYLLVMLVTLVQIGLGVWAALFDNGNANIISAVSTLVYLTFYFIAVRAHFGKTLFTLLMLSNIANFVVVSSKCIEGLIFPEFAMQSYRWTFSVAMIAVEIIVMIPLFFYIRNTYSSAFEKDIGKPTWRFLWLIPATFYLIWYYHLYGSSMSSLELALQPANSIFMLLINLGAILIYHMIIRLINVTNKNVELTNHNYLLTMQNLQYENLKERIHEARQAKHDVRHHITVMDGYINNGEYDKLKDYLNGYKRALPDDSSIVFCKHYATNALLLYFAQQAKNHKIDFAVSVSVPEQINIPDNVLSVVLGNLLENALEACSTVTDRMPQIIIKGKTEYNSVFFKISNTYCNELIQDKNGFYMSTKHPGRGVGLASIRNITADYDGIFEIEQKDGMFITSILLNIPDNNTAN